MIIQESRVPFENAHIGTNKKDIIPEENHVIASATVANLTLVEKNSDSLLLDERFLLACIARTLPATGKIRISSTVSAFLFISTMISNPFFYIFSLNISFSIFGSSQIVYQKCWHLYTGATTRKPKGSLKTSLHVIPK